MQRVEKHCYLKNESYLALSWKPAVLVLFNLGPNLTVKNQTYRVTRNGYRFQVRADKFQHLPRLPWMRSLAVLLQDKLQGWPHVGPLQPGLPGTIARLCWPILRFFLARLTTAWVTSSPARLHVYQAPALNCLWFHRAPSIKSVWKDLQDEAERTIRDSDTGPTSVFSLLSFWGFSPPFSISRWPVGQVATEEAMTDRCDDARHEMRRWGSFPYIDI